MRIAFDSKIFLQQKYGGISRYYVRLVKELFLLNEYVKIFSPLYINSYLNDISSELKSGYYLPSYNTKARIALMAYNHLLSKNQISRWKPQIVHETYYSSFGSVYKKCPIILTVYDMIHELYGNEFGVHDKTAILKKQAIERADHIICISENTKRDLISIYNIPVKKISVVLLGFDFFNNLEDNTYQLKKNVKPFLLYVGSRAGYKNFIGFLKSVAQSNKLRSEFDIIAFGGGDFTADELKFINKLDFKVNQVTQVNGDDILLGQYFRNARAFVYPSLYEGFGIPPLESMAHRCPVISSNTSSMPEVIGQAAEFFNPNCTDEIQYAIESVVFSDQRSAELIDLGEQRLVDFSWSKCANETLSVYKNLL